MANSTFKAENGLTVVGDADISANVTASVAALVGANVVANTSTLLVGNSTVNSTITSSQVRVANSTNTATLNPTSLTVGATVVNTAAIGVGANATLSTTTLSIGNSSVNTTTTLSTISVAEATRSANITITGLAVGNSTLNVVANTTQMSVANATNSITLNPLGITSAGNSASNVVVTATQVQIANSTNTATLTPVSLTIGTQVANTTGLYSGANVFANTTAVFVGNSTVNVVVSTAGTVTATGTGSGFSGNGASVTSVNAATVGSNTASDLRSYSDTVAATSYTNATNFAANATNISSGTLNTLRLPATISIGNTTINTQINSTSVSFFSNGAILLPSGNTADRPAGANGQLRYNNELGTLETYVSGNWTQPSLLGDVTTTSTPNKIVQRNATADVFANNINLGAGANVGTVVTVGGNVSLNVTTLAIGNSTVNSTATSSQIQVANSTNTATLTSTSLTIGTQVANTTGFYAGANVYANTTALNAGNTIIASALLTLGGRISANGATGSAGQVLASGGTANVYWVSPLTTGGSDTQVQFNDGGTALGGDSGLTYNKTTDILTVANGVSVGANVILTPSSVTIGNSTINTAIAAGTITFNGANSIVLPVGNTSQRPAGANGHVRYSNTTNTVEAFVNGAWAFVPTSNNSSYITVANTAVANTIVVRDSTADVYANNFYSTSDATLKVGAVPITNALDKLEEITGYLYTMMGSNDVQAGVFAQDVQKPMPYAVREQDGKLRVAYQQLIPVLWEAVKELKHIVLKR